MVNVDKIIEDIIKGAQSTEGFIRGSTMGVEHQVIGEETKLATEQQRALGSAYQAGTKAACDRYKVAWGALLSGLGRLGARAATKAAPAAKRVAKSPLGQQAAAGAAMTGGAMGAQTLMAPAQPQG